MERVGLVGVGAIGLAFLERLAAAGVRPAVYDSALAAQENARKLGADVRMTAADVGRASDIIDVVVRTDQDVLDSMLGPNGVLAGAARGTLVLLHSTIHPRTTQTVASAASKTGVEVMDACMMGMPHQARAGQEIFLVGGSEDLMARVRPHLLRLGSEAVYLGPLTASNSAKIIKNMLTGVQSLVIDEAGRLAQAAGLPDSAFEEILRLYHRTAPHPRSMLARDDNPQGSSNLYEKDLPLAVELARELGQDVPVSQHAAEVARRLVAH